MPRYPRPCDGRRAPLLAPFRPAPAPHRGQATLEGSKYAALVPAAARPSFWARLVEHAQSQFWYNRNMAVLFPRGSHAFDTAWYTWPLAAVGRQQARASDPPNTGSDQA